MALQKYIFFNVLQDTVDSCGKDCNAQTPEYMNELFATALNEVNQLVKAWWFLWVIGLDHH